MLALWDSYEWRARYKSNELFLIIIIINKTTFLSTSSYQTSICRLWKGLLDKRFELDSFLSVSLITDTVWLLTETVDLLLRSADST